MKVSREAARCFRLAALGLTERGGTPASAAAPGLRDTPAGSYRDALAARVPPPAPPAADASSPQVPTPATARRRVPRRGRGGGAGDAPRRRRGSRAARRHAPASARGRAARAALGLPGLRDRARAPHGLAGGVHDGRDRARRCRGLARRDLRRSGATSRSRVGPVGAPGADAPGAPPSRAADAEGADAVARRVTGRRPRPARGGRVGAGRGRPRGGAGPRALDRRAAARRPAVAGRRAAARHRRPAAGRARPRDRDSGSRVTKEVWKAISGPGVVLVDGLVIATWRATARRGVLDVIVSPLGGAPLPAPSRLTTEVQALAAARGLYASSVLLNP